MVNANMPQSLKASNTNLRDGRNQDEYALHSDQDLDQQQYDLQERNNRNVSKGPTKSIKIQKQSVLNSKPVSAVNSGNGGSNGL